MFGEKVLSLGEERGGYLWYHSNSQVWTWGSGHHLSPPSSLSRSKSGGKIGANTLFLLVFPLQT